MANGDDTGGGGDQPTIGGSLQELATHMGDLLKVTKSMEAAAAKTADNTGDENKRSRQTGRNIYKISDQVPIIGKIMRGVGKQISQTFKDSFKIQEAALARGMNFEGLREKVQPMTQGLETLTGSMTALQISSEMYFTGLRGNNQAMGKLALSTRLTGGNWKKLTQEMGKNTAGMGMSNEAMTSLATRTLGLSQAYHISTNELVSAMRGLGSDLNDLATLGLGADMQEATASLAAALEPGMTDLAPEIMKALTSGGTMIQNSMLGGAKEVSDLVTAGFGNKSEQTMNALLVMGKRAQEISDKYADGSMHSRFAMDRAIDVYGKQMPLYARAYKQLQQAATEQGIGIGEYARKISEQQKVNDNFAGSWENFKFKVLDPLKESVMTVAGIVLRFINSWGSTAVMLTQVIGGFLTVMGSLLLAIRAKEMVQTGWATVRNMGGLLGGGKGGPTSMIGKDAPGQQMFPGMGGGKGFLASLGEGFSGLGRGLKAIGSPEAMKGAVTIGLLAASIGILAYAMILFGNVPNKWGALVLMAAGITVLGGAAALLGKFAPQISIGAGTIALLSLALIPLGAAIYYAAPPLAILVDSLKGLTPQIASGIVAVGGALLMLGPALLAFGIGGIVGAVGLSMVTKQITTLSKASGGIASLGDSFERMGKGLGLVKESLDTFTSADISKLNTLGAQVSVALGASDERATKTATHTANQVSETNRLLARLLIVGEDGNENTESVAAATKAMASSPTDTGLSPRPA